MSPFIMESDAKERRRERRRRHQEVVEAGFGAGRVAPSEAEGLGEFPQEGKTIGHGTVGSGSCGCQHCVRRRPVLRLLSRSSRTPAPG